MLRELNDEEMMMVSGGDAPAMPDPMGNPTPLERYLEQGNFGSGSGDENGPGGANYEVIATGSINTGSSSASGVSFNDWVADRGAELFDLLDLNNDGDLYEEGAWALGILALTLSTGGADILVYAGVAGSAALLGAYAYWDDAQTS